MDENNQIARNYLRKKLSEDLLGPQSVDEELLDSPTTHYITGILFPGNTSVSSEEDDDSNSIPGVGEQTDEGTEMASALNPSSIGLSFQTDENVRVEIRVSFATYEKKKLETEETVWQRKPFKSDPLPLVLNESNNGIKKQWGKFELFVRTRKRKDFCTTTITLTNRNKCESEGNQQDEYCYFQPEIVVNSLDNRQEFKNIRRTEFSGSQEDVENSELLYFHFPEFAVGHGCAVDWETDGDESAKAIRTKIIPDFELPQFSPDFEEQSQVQEMNFLYQFSREVIVNHLRGFLDKYYAWIELLKTQVGDYPERLHAACARNIRACEDNAERIINGIELIEKDDLIFQAFQLANHAMFLQRSRTEWIKNGKNTVSPDETIPQTWRPFQLAFILLCLRSIYEANGIERDILDLLWFPTGGGKTEAYLGLTAFTIFYRRLSNDGKKISSGVTVLMRYTLRLLTLQQFLRASSLIMACEVIRRQNESILGKEKISIGMWVGGGAAPNTRSKALIALNKILNDEDVREGNPHQIIKCPWCGEDISPRNIDKHDFNVHCPNDDCDFTEGMPLYIIDEVIYEKRPTLIIGTVDKFARLTWVSEAANLFGGVNSRYLSPELIIQDELHLISGPLGSLVGLYETAIDYLCSKNGQKPKIIASTATIRRAQDQCKFLYDRGLNQFPPPGLDARDSFYSHQVSTDLVPGRLYLGIHAAGKSMKTTLLRVYANILQRIHELDLSDIYRDPYWTLVGYFNSLRELGGAVRLVEDDVRERMKVISNNKNEIRSLDYIEELNSRKNAQEIPDILDALDGKLGETTPVDVLLATNMIGVGMDVDRLGLMVVNGQPKSTSEYIQATSRVGRKFPGIVITVYNWTRPRDRSHYERFINDHSTLYSQVEAASVTPFSSRARDKGLHGIFISMLRHKYPILNPDSGAAKIAELKDEIKSVIDFILERVNKIDFEEASNTENELEKIMQRWEFLARSGELVYHSWKRDDLKLLISAEDADEKGSGQFPTLNSLRDVESQSGLYILTNQQIH